MWMGFSSIHSFSCSAAETPRFLSDLLTVKVSIDSFVISAVLLPACGSLSDNTSYISTANENMSLISEKSPLNASGGIQTNVPVPPRADSVDLIVSMAIATPKSPTWATALSRSVALSKTLAALRSR